MKRFFLAVVMGTFPVLGLCQQPQQAPSVETKQQAKEAPKKKEETKSAATPPAKAAAPEATPKREDPKSSKVSHKGGYETSEFWTVFGRRLKITDTLLVFFTLILAVATWRLWLSTRDLVSQAADRAKTELRAYVSFKHAYLSVRRLPGDNRILAKVTITNVGKTPARRVRLAIHVEVRDRMDGEFPSVFRDGFTHLQPGIEWNVQQVNTEDTPITEQMLNRDFMNRTQFIILWGEMTYLDIFDKPQFYRFRYRQGFGHIGIAERDVPNWNRKRTTKVREQIVQGWDVAPCPEGNEAT